MERENNNTANINMFIKYKGNKDKIKINDHH